MRVLARTYKGPRDLQQDAFAWEEMGRADCGPRLCCCLADGMGGVHGGGVASRLAVSAVIDSLHPSLMAVADDQWRDSGFYGAAIRTALARAGAILGDASRGDPSLEQMATTVAIVVQVGSFVLVCYSGDTRVYAYEEHLELLTKDHSTAWPLVESELIDASELRHVGTRSVLTKYLGPDCVEFETTTHDAGTGASYLLATDGFWELFDSRDLERLMAPLRSSHRQGNPEDVADSLLREAEEREPADNATFILVTPGAGTSGQTVCYPYPGRPHAFVRTDLQGGMS